MENFSRYGTTWNKGIIFRDDLQLISQKIKTAPHSPFFTALIRLQKRSEGLPQVKFNEQRRIVVLGAAKVGKSAIIHQFLFDTFVTKYRKTVEDLYRAEYDLSNGGSLTLEILDTAGFYEFPAMRSLAISNANAFILVYSVDNEGSFEEVKRLRKEIIDARGQTVPIVIVANKTDEAGIDRVVQREAVDMDLKLWHCRYLECNVKNNINIVDIFSQALAQLDLNYDLNEAVCRRRKLYEMYTVNGKNKRSDSCRIN